METPFFTYQGSKASLRKWILPYMPTEGKRYIEPFAGRGNVFFLARQQLNFKSWVLNDTATRPFLCYLQDPLNLDWLPEKMTWKLFKYYKDRWEDYRWDHCSLLIEPGIAHLGHYRSGWMGKYTRTRAWSKEKYSERLLKANELLKDVTISGLSWQSLVETPGFTNQDFMYFDPPYLDTEHRYYEDIDHPCFLKAIKNLKCKWLLSHTDHPLYREHLGEPHAMKIRKPGGKAVGRVSGSKFVECLWRNYQ